MAPDVLSTAVSYTHLGPGVQIPASPPGREGILSASAGVPKKDFPLIIEAMSLLPPMRKTIILACSNGFESLPGEVTALARDRDPSITVLVGRCV